MYEREDGRLPAQGSPGPQLELQLPPQPAAKQQFFRKTHPQGQGQGIEQRAHAQLPQPAGPAADQQRQHDRQQQQGGLEQPAPQGQ